LGRGTGLVLILVGTVLVLYAVSQAFAVVSSGGRGRLPSFLLIPSVRDFLHRFSGDVRDLIENCMLAAFLLVVEGIGVGLIALGTRPFSGERVSEGASGKP